MSQAVFSHTRRPVVHDYHRRRNNSPLTKISERAHDMSYNRTLSPGGRRLANPARSSDSNVDAYHSQRHNSYAAKPTDRVIPISTQTFINVPSSSSGRSSTSYDPYSGRPRRNSLLDQGRSRPNVIQSTDLVRTTSPSRRGTEYYVTPAVSKKEPRKSEHRKVYSVDDSGAKLVTDHEPREREHHRHHRRRESEDRGGYREDRARKSYPVKRKEKSIEDDDAYSYTDAAGMYKETQPSWRERETRPRRGSVDRNGGSRERPVSMLLDPYVDRKSTREGGPPLSSRGWDKLNDGISRTRSVREGPREPQISHSPSRHRDGRGEYRDSHYLPRRESNERRTTAIHDDRYDDREYDREPRHERRWSATRPQDRSVSRRGFGIRGVSSERRRTSDEDLKNRGFGTRASPERRRPSDEDLKGRGFGIRAPSSDRDDYADRKRFDDRSRHTRDREHERDDRRYDSEDEYYRSRKNTSDKDRRHRYDDRDDDRTSHDGVPTAAKVAAGGLAAAGLYEFSKDRDRKDDKDHARENDGLQPPRADKASDRRSKSRSDDDPYQKERRADPDRGLGFAFEGEPPRNARDAEDTRPRPDDREQRPRAEDREQRPRTDDRERQRAEDRELERPHEDMPPTPATNVAVDPDEEYRRRIQQAQRELGYESTNQEPDPDRERRRREREARLQGRQERQQNGDTTAGAPPYPDERSPMRSTFDAPPPPPESTISSATSRPSELHRRPSIIDAAMPEEPTAQIIDNSLSEKRENRVRIVDPPTEEEDKKPKGILKKPKVAFPEDKNVVREGVAPLKDSTKKGIPPGARWTKIDRRLVNPEALEEAKERYEERLDCVIVLRVLTKEDIQKLADRTKELRNKRFEAEDRSRRHRDRDRDRDRDRRERDEYSDDGLEDWERVDQKPIRMLEAPPASEYSDRKSEQRDRDREPVRSGH